MRSVERDMAANERADLLDSPNGSRRARQRLGQCLAFLALTACAEVSDSNVTVDDEVVLDESSELEGKMAIAVSGELVRSTLESAPKAANGLPLWQSRPGARVALFLDFDGGRYNGRDYRGIDRDGDRSRFGTDEQAAIMRAALEVVEGYKPFDVNVTTSEAVMRAADRWGWLLITDDKNASGEAVKGTIARSSMCQTSRCSAMGFVGSNAVFSPPSAQRGYLLIHEFGHQFGLNHSGLYYDGTFYEWSDLKRSSTGDWMGGRSSSFDGYSWMRLQSKYSTSIQDPEQIIASVAGYAKNDGTDGESCHTAPLHDSFYCSSSCPCSAGEGDCDDDSQCAAGFVCEQRSGTDYCVAPEGRASCHQGSPGDRSYCSSSCPCAEGEGDCDSDAQCAYGLVCVQVQSPRVDTCARP